MEEQKSKEKEEEEEKEKRNQDELLIEQLKKDSMLERLNKRPEHKEKRESNSEAAKIARYNMKLLESIYQAYEPEQADNVVKVFRKGGVFSVEPIMEEDFEESFDIESQGTLDRNATLLAGGAVGETKNGTDGIDDGRTNGIIGGPTNGTNNGLTLLKAKDKYGKQDTLGDIKEENSMLLDDDGKLVKKEDEKEDDLELFKGDNQSEQTGYDFNKENPNDIFGLGSDENNGFNALAVAGDDLAKGSKDKVTLLDQNKLKFEDSSSEFEDETNLGGVTMNQRGKKKRRRRRKKKNPKYNDKIRQLEEIYDNGEGTMLVN